MVLLLFLKKLSIIYKSRRGFAMNIPTKLNETIVATDNVFKRIHFLREKAKNPNLKLRISVSGGGCSGFLYNYSMVEEENADDLVIAKDNLKIFIDPASAEFLQESVIDFIEELGTSYFSIKNPSATAKCGCGNSFAI